MTAPTNISFITYIYMCVYIYIYMESRREKWQTGKASFSLEILKMTMFKTAT